MTTSDPTTPGTVSALFSVVIDDIDGSYDLGTFVSCEGIGLTVEVEDRVEGGNNGFVWKLPTRVSYGNVTLTRPPGPDTAKLLEWFASLRNGVRRTTGRIVALAFAESDRVEWTLEGVVPVRYQGPSFSADSTSPALETLEIAHHGFKVK